MCTQNKSSQLDCDIFFLWYEIEKILRAVYVHAANDHLRSVSFPDAIHKPFVHHGAVHSNLLVLQAHLDIV